MELKKDNWIKGGSFIINDQTPNDVFTPEDFTEEQTMMKEALQEFIDREVWPHKDRFEKKDYALTKEIMEKIGELGFLGVSVPEAYGGLGMDFVSTMLVCDYVSGATGAVSTAFGAHTGIGTLPILLYGTEKQKKKYVTKLVSGEWFGSYCLTEPGAGSDANSGKTKAVLSDDGTHYSLSGQKMWISNAGFASVFIVFARIEDDKNITGFIVPKDDSNGITLGDEENKLGLHSSSTRQVFFNETKVPVENMLAGRGEGFKIAMNSLNVGRIKLGVACLDAQRRIATASVKYANERIQFNKPIAQFGAIKEKLAQIATSTYAGESTCYRAAYDVEKRIQSFIAEGLSHQEAELKGVEDFAIECSLLKVGASEDIQNTADHGIQIMGGMGFSADMPMESAWRDSRIGRIYEGTNEINRMLSVGMLLKKGMKGQLDLMSSVMKATTSIKEVTSIPKDMGGILAEERRLLSNFKQLFIVLTGNAAQKYGDKLEAHQQVLLALADIFIEIYFTESTILRTLKNCERSGEESQKIQIAMTKSYLYEASDIIAKKGKEVILNICNGDEQKQFLEILNKKLQYKEYPDIIGLKTQVADKMIEENCYCF
tara:strand:- start:4448 stop:6247 length:1800 start_codon:yes stop_codon:yes gene_type:complete